MTMSTILQTYDCYPVAYDHRTNICDHLIDDIEVNTESVTFHFADGYAILAEDKEIKVESGCIQLKGEQDEDSFSCWIIALNAEAKDNSILGVPVSLRELGTLLKTEGSSIQVFCEMYEAHRLHWRGVIVPRLESAQRRVIVIETIDDFEMVCITNERKDT